MAAPAGNMAEFGSDVVAETLRALDIPYIAINPGASFRGLHDSLVNHLGNERPQLLLCLHEEAAVAIAHGYAKVTGRAMAAAVHSNVGLFHATMAMFNAWCDRMPVLVIGATGPVDAAKRRPWIDWIHTARDQGAIVRGYTKWDDQPGSAEAAREAVARAFWIANTLRRARPMSCWTPGCRRSVLTAPLAALRRAPLDPGRCRRRRAGDDRLRMRAMLDKARQVVILAGRASRAWRPGPPASRWPSGSARASSPTSRSAPAFPTDHPLHVGAPAVLAPVAEAQAALCRGRRHSEPRLGGSGRHLARLPSPPKAK